MDSELKKKTLEMSIAHDSRQDGSSKGKLFIFTICLSVNEISDNTYIIVYVELRRI